jgi:hypothetical protein
MTFDEFKRNVTMDLFTRAFNEKKSKAGKVRRMKPSIRISAKPEAKW